MPDPFNDAWHRERRTLRRRVRFHIGLRQRFTRRYGRYPDDDIFVTTSPKPTATSRTRTRTSIAAGKS
jgi:hypothetical protein